MRTKFVKKSQYVPIGALPVSSANGVRDIRDIFYICHLNQFNVYGAFLNNSICFNPINSGTWCFLFHLFVNNFFFSNFQIAVRDRVGVRQWPLTINPFHLDWLLLHGQFNQIISIPLVLVAESFHFQSERNPNNEHIQLWQWNNHKTDKKNANTLKSS